MGATTKAPAAMAIAKRVNLRLEVMTPLLPVDPLGLENSSPPPRLPPTLQLPCHLKPGYKQPSDPAQVRRGEDRLMTIGMRGAATLLAILGGTGLAGVSLAQAVRSGQAQVEAGQALYNTRCAQCHAADLRGHEGPAL